MPHNDSNNASRRRASWISTATIVVLLVTAYFSHLINAPDGARVSKASTRWADEASCIQCHEQASEFSRTGHAQTLRPASDRISRDLLSQLETDPRAKTEGISVTNELGSVVATRQKDGIETEIKLDWCFGSGEHACTWVSLIPDSHGNTEALEFRFTWFPLEKRFGITPGQPLQPGVSSVSSMGVLFGAPKTRRCLACHATFVPEIGGQVQDGIKTGVTCQRCHGPRGKHVATGGEFHPQGWSKPGRMESVRRCAVCHRLPEEHPPDEIVPGNINLVRFQPVGLLQSECFRQSEMTCTACHDPHMPLHQQDTRGIWQCIQCHDPQIEQHTLCGLHKTDDCLTCHMPKVRMTSPVTFTENWIRSPDRPDGDD